MKIRLLFALLILVSPILAKEGLAYKEVYGAIKLLKTRKIEGAEYVPWYIKPVKELDLTKANFRIVSPDGLTEHLSGDKLEDIPLEQLQHEDIDGIKQGYVLRVWLPKNHEKYSEWVLLHDLEKGSFETMFASAIFSSKTIEERRKEHQQNTIDERNQKIKEMIDQLDPSNKDHQEIKQFIEQILEAKSDQDILKVHLAWLEKHPNHTGLLNVSALLMWKLGKLDEAKEYIDKSLTIETSDSTLETFTIIYIARSDLDGLSKRLADLEAVEEKSPILIRALLALSEKKADIKLFRRTSDYINANKIQDPKVIRDQNKVAEFFQKKAQTGDDK